MSPHLALESYKLGSPNISSLSRGSGLADARGSGRGELAVGSYC